MIRAQPRPEDVGVYEIEIELSDIYRQSYTIFTLTVLPSDYIIEIKTLPGLLDAEIDSLDRSGLVKIVFSEPILIPANFQEFRKLQVIDFGVMRNGVTINGLVSSWNITKFTAEYITVQVEFTKPEQLSMTSSYDKLVVEFLLNGYFIS